MANQPRLLDQVRNLIRTRQYSIRADDTYTGWIKRFIFFHGKRHPEDMRKKAIEEFLTDLAVNKNVAASTQNQAFNALLFLYREVLGMNFGSLENVTRAKKPQKLPVVFTREEIRSILDQLEGDKWLRGQLLYGSGLRAMECVRLRVKNVDFSYKQITVRNGKGGKDRVTMLPEIGIPAMEKHLRKFHAIHQRDTCPMRWQGNTHTQTKAGPGSSFSPHPNAASTPGAGWKGGTIYTSPSSSRSSVRMIITFYDITAL